MRLSTTGLQVRRRWRTVIEDATIDIGTGVHGLLGANGSGKTTLLRCLATGIRAAGGDYSLEGKPVRSNLVAARRALGFAPQRPVAIRHLTVGEQVGYAAWLKSYPLHETERAVGQALESVDLADHRAAKVGTLSGGELKRLGIAMAIVSDPRVVLLDEPTAGLDAGQRQRFYDLLAGLRPDRTVLFSSHLGEDFAATCDDVIVVNRGRTTFQGPPGELPDGDTGSCADVDGVPGGRTRGSDAPTSGGQER